MEASLPTHMMLVSMQRVIAAGYEARADLIRNLNVAAVVPLAKLDELSVARVAKRVDDATTALLRDTHAVNELDALFATAMFVMVLVDEGLLTDVRSMPVLSALLLLEDLKNEEPDVNGERPVWALKEKRFREQGYGLLKRAQLLGYYIPGLRN